MKFVSQTRVTESGTRAQCLCCAWYMTIREAGGAVTALRAAAMRHVRQSGHTVRRYVEDITEYAPEAASGGDSR